MTNNIDDTLQKLCSHLQGFAADGNGIDPDGSLAGQFALDSVKVLDLIMEIEDAFDISIPMNVMADVQTVRDLAQVIHELESGR